MGLSDVLVRLQAVLNALDTDPDYKVDPPVCRVGIVPGPAPNGPTRDSCGQSCNGDSDGQLWASLNGAEVTDSEQCQNLRASVSIGILRCAAVINDNGDPPTALEVLQDVSQQTFDADTIYNLVSSEDFKHTFDIVSWTPLPPDGGCIGGFWNYTVNIGMCV